MTCTDLPPRVMLFLFIDQIKDSLFHCQIGFIIRNTFYIAPITNHHVDRVVSPSFKLNPYGAVFIASDSSIIS